MSVTIVLHTSVCFVILCVKNKHSPKKRLPLMDVSPFIIIRVFPQWLFCFSFNMLLLPRFLYSTDLKQTCIFLFCICTQYIRSNFPPIIPRAFNTNNKLSPDLSCSNQDKISLKGGVFWGGMGAGRREGVNYFMQI